MDEFLLVQCFSEPTHENNTFDLALTHCQEAALDCHTIPLIATDDIQDHRAILLIYVLSDCSRQHYAECVAPLGSLDLSNKCVLENY